MDYNKKESPDVLLEGVQNINKALRFNKGKPKWSLVHYKSLEPLVRVLETGANKYSRNNWKLGLDRDEILDSLQRHLAALMDGEEFDEESELPHVGHIMANAMFLQYYSDIEKVDKCGGLIIEDDKK